MPLPGHIQSVIERARDAREAPRAAATPGGAGGGSSEFKVFNIVMVFEALIFGVNAWNENFEAAVPGSVVAILGFAYTITRFVLKSRGADVAMADAKAEEMMRHLQSAYELIAELRVAKSEPLRAVPVDPASIPPERPFSPFETAQSDRDTPPGV